jgi:hypothetical protein
MFGLALIMILRRPEFFLEPRFWGEEGRDYFVFARSHGFFENIFWEEFGYLNLWAKLTSFSASRLVALENAPIVTTVACLVIQLAPFYLILTSRSEIWVSHLQRYLAVGVLLVSPYMGEVWLTSINTQHLMPVIAFLILIDQSNLQTRLYRYFQRLMLLLCGLSGPMSAFLTPLFIWDAWKSVEREKAVKALLMIMVCVLHAAFIGYVIATGSRQVGGRISGMSFATFFLIVWNRTIMTPILGGIPASRLMDWFQSSSRIVFHLAGGVAFIATLAAVWFFIHRAPLRIRVLLAGSWAWISLIGINAALGDKNGMIGPVYSARYFVATAFIFLLMLILYIDPRRLRNELRPKIAVTLIILSLVNGLLTFRSALYYDETWPKWRDEVKKWREDPTHELAIWPPPWKMKLPAENQAR